MKVTVMFEYDAGEDPIGTQEQVIYSRNVGDMDHYDLAEFFLNAASVGGSEWKKLQVVLGSGKMISTED